MSDNWGDDWGASANAPTFTLFKNTSPEEEAKKQGYVDGLIYNRWTKAERRLYNKLKTQSILRSIEQEQLRTVDDLATALDSLNFIKADSQENDPLIDDLITKVEKLKVGLTNN